MNDNQLIYLLALHSTDGLGPVRLKGVLDYFGSPENAWNAPLAEFIPLGIPKNVLEKLKEKRKTLDPISYYQKIIKSGVKVLSLFDEGYPKLLKEIYDPPVIIFYRGEIDWNQRCIAVVGTRKVTGYGRTVTEKITEQLCSSGLIIVSGLARGVDTIAHKTAVKNRGQTIAVLGGGVNNIFPPENLSLAREIEEGYGAVISEFMPEYPSLPGNFPSRNRIIAGLSLATVVTEAAEDSGSLITARLALDYGREVFAVPGPITSSLSLGPASLIKDGARLLTSGQEIIEELGIGKYQISNIKFQMPNDLSGEEKEVLEILEREEKHIDEIVREAGKPSAVISAVLIKLEIQGYIKSLGGGVYVKNV